MGDRFWLFIQTLNNDKKPFNSIFNSKTKSNYSFKEFIHSKTKSNYSFKEFIHSNWKKLFIIRSKICKSEIWKIVLKKYRFWQKVLKFHLPMVIQRYPPNSQSFIASLINTFCSNLDATNVFFTLYSFFLWKMHFLLFIQ